LPFDVEVEPSPDAPDAAAAWEAAAEVEHHLKSMIGVTCAVVVKARGAALAGEGGLGDG